MNVGGVFCPTPNSKSIRYNQNTNKVSKCGIYMAEINFHVEDQISGNSSPLVDVEDTLTMQHFLIELSQYGFVQFEQFDEIHALMVDQKAYPWTAELRKKKLAEIGVVEGCILSIRPKVFV